MIEGLWPEIGFNSKACGHTDTPGKSCSTCYHADLVDQKDSRIQELEKELAETEDEMQRGIQEELDRNIRLAKESMAKSALLSECRPFLHALEMGDQMDCMECGEGNLGEVPEHKNDCKLNAFIAKLSHFQTSEKS